MVAFGLQAAERFDTPRLVMPNTRLVMQLSSDAAAWDVTEVRKAFANWTIACGLRELIEEFSEALALAREFLAAWALGSGEIRGEDWNHRMVDEGRRFHRLGLPDKLDFFRREYQVELPADKEADLFSINRARNCLVHRQGIVGLQDIAVTKEEFGAALENRRRRFPEEKWTNGHVIAALGDAGRPSALEVTWLQMEAFVAKDGEEKVIDPSEEVTKIEAGATVGLRMVRARRAFEFGSLVRFDANAFSHIAYALLNCAIALRDAVQARGHEMGVTFSDASSAGAG